MMKKIHDFESEILEEKSITPNVKHFKISVPEDFEFVAGQFVIMSNPDRVSRPYSIASSPPQKGYIEFCIKKEEKGKLTQYLHNLKKGGKIGVKGPFKGYTFKENKEGSVFIATGTGISPFRSMITYILETGCCQNKIILLTGVRYEEDVLYDEEWKELKDKFNNFEYHSIVSRPKNPDYKGDIGRVQQLLDKYVPKDFKGDYYICGYPKIAEDIKKFLIEKGVSEERISSEPR